MFLSYKSSTEKKTNNYPLFAHNHSGLCITVISPKFKDISPLRQWHLMALWRTIVCPWFKSCLLWTEWGRKELNPLIMALINGSIWTCSSQRFRSVFVLCFGHKFSPKRYLDFSRGVDEVSGRYLLCIFLLKPPHPWPPEMKEKKSLKTYFPLRLFKVVPGSEGMEGQGEKRKLASGCCLHHSLVNANKAILLFRTSFAPKTDKPTSFFVS